MTSPDLTASNITKIVELFPGVITETIDAEGNTVSAIDFDLLRQELSDHVVEGAQERYQLDWPGKRAAAFAANAPVAKTLRPARHDSVDYETTGNLFLEGDNLDALKLVQESYLGRVKLVYLDPPYNTGSDMIYHDDFVGSAADYEVRSGQLDAAGARLVTNLESNGRFHSDWLSMMYPRLKLARNLLTSDGAIVVSIDDTELPRLRQLMDEIFGAANFVGCVVWERAYSPINLKKHLSASHDYIVVYARSLEELGSFSLPRDEAATARYRNPDHDSRGPWKSSDLSVGPAVQANIYAITTPSGRSVMPPSGYSWRLSRAKFDEFVADKRIWFGPNGDAVPSIKRFLSEVKSGVTPMTIWKHPEVGHSQSATQDLKRLFDDKALFSYPKPVRLMQRIVQLTTSGDDVVLDLFAGSGTTAHAVMAQNALDGGSRRFVMMQLDEAPAAGSEAARQGYLTIAEIARDRLRRAGTAIVSSQADGSPTLDVGFRTLRVDTSNMSEVFRTPDETDQQALAGFESSVKPERSGEDLLFQVLLDWGLDLSLPFSVHRIEGREVFVVEGGALVACFDDGLSRGLVRALAEYEPLRVVFRDSGFASDDDRINAEQIFNELLPTTDVKAI